MPEDLTEFYSLSLMCGREFRRNKVLTYLLTVIRHKMMKQIISS